MAESVIYDPIAPTEPTVVAQTTNSTTPTLSGTVTLNPGDTFTVTVAGTEYSEGTNLTQDGDLDIGDSGRNAIARGRL